MTHSHLATGNQTLLSLHLYRDPAPSQQPGSNFYTGSADDVPLLTKQKTLVRRGELDYVFKSMMLGAQTQSKWMDSVYQMSSFKCLMF